MDGRKEGEMDGGIEQVRGRDRGMDGGKGEIGRKREGGRESEQKSTVFTRLNAAAFITFELAEGGGAYLGAAFIRGRRLLFQCEVTVLILLLHPAMVQAVGTVAGSGALEKESQ